MFLLTTYFQKYFKITKINNFIIPKHMGPTLCWKSTKILNSRGLAVDVNWNSPCKNYFYIKKKLHISILTYQIEIHFEKINLLKSIKVVWKFLQLEIPKKN